VGGDEPERHALDYFRAGADAVLIDTFHDGKVGSTGLTVDFEVARRVRDTVRPGPLILAGGETPEQCLVREIKEELNLDNG